MAMNSKIKFKKMDYQNLTRYLMFTDLKFSQFSNETTTDERLMINDKLNIQNFDKFPSQISTPEKVEQIALYFPEAENKNLPEAEKKFENKIELLIKECESTFGKAKIYLYSVDEALLESIEKQHPQRLILTEPKSEVITSKDFENLVMNFLNISVRFYYFTCHHLLLNYMEMRCQNNDIVFLCNDDNFCFTQISTTLNFIRNPEDKTFGVYENGRSNNLLLKLTNEHLHGLYKPYLLFELVKTLIKLRKIAKLDIVIDNNEIVIPSLSSKSLSSKDSETVFEMLQKNKNYLLPRKFKIQLSSDNGLVLNRKLKVSISVMNFLLKNNAIEEIVDLAIKYFKCFSIRPVCCRMQSLAPKAAVFDFEKFTYLHIDKNRKFYIEVCKILFPFVADIPEDLLQQSFLEIVPVSLIGRFHGEKLRSFNERLREIQAKLNITPLANGNFEIGAFFNISPDMLSKLCNIQKLEAAVKLLTDSCNSGELNKTDLVKHEENLGSYFPLDAVKIIKDNEISEGFLIQNDFQCHFCNTDDKNNLFILSCEQYQIICIESKNYVFEMTSNLSSMCQYFSEAFVTEIKLATLEEKSIKTCEKKLSLNPIKYFDSLKKTEGIGLELVDNTIVTTDRKKIAMKESNPDFYKNTADYCYYNEDDSIKFFKLIQKDKLQKLLKMNIIEITSFGFIRFDNCVEISPTTFLTIFDAPRLLTIIKIICGISKNESSKMVKFEYISNFHPFHWQISIAKKLNPSLENLYDSFFLIPFFRCIPNGIFVTLKGNEILDALTFLRNHQIRIRLSQDAKEIILNCSWFREMNMFENSTDFFSTFIDFCEKMETLNGHFDGCYSIQLPSTLEIVDHENFEINMLSNDIIFQRRKDITKDDFLKCSNMFESFAESVRIVENKYFYVNSGIGISCENFLKFKGENLKMFFEAAKLYGSFISNIGILFPDNWINVAKHETISGPFKDDPKFKSFCIVDDNKESHMTLSKMLTKCLEDVPSEDLFSYKWLELLPKQLLMSDEEIMQLIESLENVRQNRPTEVMKLTNSGSIKIGSISLSASQWLKINSIENLITAFESKKFRLESSGLLQYILPSNDVDVLIILEKLLKASDSMETSIPIQIDSEGKVMLGTFIWADIRHLNNLEKEAVEIVHCFKRETQFENENRTKSINGLNGSQKKMAIALAKLINKNLLTASEELICHPNFMSLSTEIWNLCKNDNPEYEQLKKVFEAFQRNSIKFNLQFNGNFEIWDKIVISNLSTFYDNFQNIKHLMSLFSKIHLKQLPSILCEDEVKQRQLRNEKVFGTKIASSEKVMQAKREMEKKNIKCRIEPNNTLFINENIWVTAENALNCRYNVAGISKKLKEHFPDDRFQYGHPEMSILTSTVTSPDRQLFEYCYNMCLLIMEKYSNDIQIEYISSRNLFRFNDVISFHPRSFFHVKNMEEIVELIKGFGALKVKMNEYTLKKEKIPASLIEEERKLCIRYQQIKKTERLEYDILSEKCFEKLGKIIWKEKNFSHLKSIGNIGSLTQENIKEIQINDEFIMRDGSSINFTIIKNGAIKLKYKENRIVEAIKIIQN